MKRITMIIITIFIIIIAICCFFILAHNKTNMSFVKTGETIFQFNDSDFQMQLSNEDLSSIIEIFNNKRLYIDNPSCGFTKNVSIIFNNKEIFCIACDSCPVIFWENQNRYFKLSEKENSTLKSILKKYGFIFPCI